jgi:hypothetical protein
MIVSNVGRDDKRKRLIATAMHAAIVTSLSIFIDSTLSGLPPKAIVLPAKH